MRECSLSIGIVTYRSADEVVRRLLESLSAAVRRAEAQTAMDVTIQLVCNDDETARFRAPVRPGRRPGRKRAGVPAL